LTIYAGRLRHMTPSEPAAPVAANYPEHDPQAGLSATQALTIVRAHLKLSAIIILAIVLVAAAFLKSMPKKYVAMATLIVNTDSKDPLAGQDFPVNALTNYVATQTELILSPVVLLPVVDRLKLTQDAAYTAGFSGGSVDELREYVEKSLAASLQVDTGRGGELLYVSASAKDPVKAADIANAVADVYLDQERRRVNDPAGERAQRYSEELAELRAKATAAQDRVTEFRQRSGITNVVAANNDTEIQALTSLETQLLAAQDQRRALEAKQSVAPAPTDDAVASTQITLAQTQLDTLEAQLVQQSSTLGPRHPAVVELNARIGLARLTLDKAKRAYSDGNATALTQARNLEEKLTRAVADQRVKVLALRQFQDEGAKLTLELESAQAVYKRALDGYDQIMFASAGNFTNVSFISRATPALKPSNSNKMKFLAVAIVAALGLGLGAPLGYELLVNRRLRCRDDFERDFGIPVLAQFDAISPPGSP